MSKCFAVYLRELIILKRKFWRQIASMSVSPLLYLIAFGFGLGNDLNVGGRPYLEFLIPGLIAMGSMVYSFGIATEINVARFYWKIFEEFQAAPVPNIAYVSGEVLAGITRALISVIIILIIGFISGVNLSYGPGFWVAVLLNSFLFSSLAVGLAMIVKSHADQSLLSSFLITPMSFLGGTFFPVDKMPVVVQKILYFIPLTHASNAIRASAYGEKASGISYLVLVVIGIVCFIFAVNVVNKARD
ncbi:MAG: ABC transporter permease [Spirochaetes bacterium]|nr:ABC transporter permease [Spirochaetota bacterium]